MLAQACLSVLLQDPKVDSGASSAPLLHYAAKHWVAHAQVENVASRIRDGVVYIFDPEKSYFEQWVQLHDADADTIYRQDIEDLVSGARPMYYAALCGLHDAVEHLHFEHPQHATATGGRLGTPLHAASFGGHLQIVQLLLRHGVDVDIQAFVDRTPLRFASQSGHSDVVRCLIDHGADANAKEASEDTPLNWAAYGGHVDAVRVLLERNADVHSQDVHGRTPLHDAIWGENPKGDYTRAVRLLLEPGADPNARDTEQLTTLHLMPMRPTKLDVLRLLLEHGADLGALDEEGRTPWQASLERGHAEITRLHSGDSSRA